MLTNVCQKTGGFVDKLTCLALPPKPKNLDFLQHIIKSVFIRNNCWSVHRTAFMSFKSFVTAFFNRSIDDYCFHLFMTECCHQSNIISK